MDKKLSKEILDVVMTRIGESLTIQDFKFKNVSDDQVLQTLKDLVENEYLLASQLCTDSAEECLIIVNNVTEKGLDLHKDLRNVDEDTDQVTE